MRNRGWMVALAGLTCMALGRSALATPSGLDNIPTADTAPDRVLVLQGYDTFGDKTEHDFAAGLKFGLDPFGDKGWAPEFEGGLDMSLFPGESGPVVLQGKVALHPYEMLPAVALGSANIALTSADRDRTGEPFNYLVLSEDLKYFRVHAGYAVQTHNNAGFFGVDTFFKAFEHDITLRADAIQTNDQKYWLTSAGVMFPLTKNLVFEGWANIPVDHRTVSFTLKLDWVIGN